MFCYIVALDSENQNTIEQVKRRVLAYSGVCPINKTTWAIKTALPNSEVLKNLSSVISTTDKLLVIRSGTEATWIGYPPTYSDWFRRNF